MEVASWNNLQELLLLPVRTLNLYPQKSRIQDTAKYEPRNCSIVII